MYTFYFNIGVDIICHVDINMYNSFKTKASHCFPMSVCVKRNYQETECAFQFLRIERTL